MLTDKIQNDLKESQLAKDAVRISTLRLLLSEMKNAQISKGDILSDDEILRIVQKEVRKRKEAAAGFRQGGKEMQALQEEAEQKILESYLPEQMSNDQLTKLIEESIKELGAQGMQDMGKVMGVVMEKISGRADGKVVSNLVREKLTAQ